MDIIAVLIIEGILHFYCHIERRKTEAADFITFEDMYEAHWKSFLFETVFSF